jgi:hypothetical protein
VVQKMAGLQGLCKVCGLSDQCVLGYICGDRVERKSHISKHFPPQENAQDSSIDNLQSNMVSPAVEVNGSSGTNYIPVPPPLGWCLVRDEDSGEPCYVNIATGVKVCCKSLGVADCWKW